MLVRRIHLNISIVIYRMLATLGEAAIHLNSPRVFILGDPVVRRVSSKGGLPEDAIRDCWEDRGTIGNQRSWISIETGTETR